MEKINLLFDGRMLLNCFSNNASRSGVFFSATNILQQFVKNKSIKKVSIYLSKQNEQLLVYLKGIGCDVEIVSESNQLKDYNIYFSCCEKYPDFLSQYNQITKYTMVHDTLPIILPSYFRHIYDNTYWWNILCCNINKNDYYFTNSEYTKQDFLKYFPNDLAENQITTTLLAVNERFHKCTVDEVKKAKAKYKVPAAKKYVFSLCTLEPRKNLIRAVKTFIEFIKKNKIDDLVFVLGGGHWDAFIGKLKAEISDLGEYQDKIIRAGYIADEDLAPLYSGAEWFVYTSQYEGFGLPPLEAMSCGTAVITSNNSSLPEVVGGAGQMIDWDSDEQHIAAYEKYYFDKKFRTEMAKKGLERSKQFSWKKCADTMVNKMLEVQEKKKRQPLVAVIAKVKNFLPQSYANIEYVQDIRRAKGKYVFLCSDDFALTDKDALKMLVRTAEEYDADGVAEFKPLPFDLADNRLCLIKRELYEDADNANYTLLYRLMNKNADIRFLNRKVLELQKNIEADEIEQIFEQNYGQFHNLSPYEITLLNRKKYRDFPAVRSGKLGAKLQKPEWIEEYIKGIPLNADNRNFGVQGEVFKQRYTVKLFNFLPLFTRKQRGGKVQYKFFGIPLFTVRRMANGFTTKYYTLGISLLKVTKK